MPRRRKQKPEDIQLTTQATGLITASDLPQLDPALVAQFTESMADPVATLKEHPSITTAAELSPPEQEIIDPQGKPDRGSHVEGLRHRPTGPRPRNGEPAASFASEELRIIKDGYTWQIQSKRELTSTEKDRLAASGFQAVDDDERVWNATQRELARRGTDINAIALALGKPEVAGRGR